MTLTEEITARLFTLRDEKYRLFQAKLMPTVDPARIIGVRTPALRDLAKEYSSHPKLGEYLDALPHAYYDENNLHGFLLARGKDYAETLSRVDAFLPYVDNWATCDLLSPKVFSRHKHELRGEIDRWIADPAPFTIRFGIEMAMSHFLDADFDPALFSPIAAIRNEEYYVRMMVAWFFATALAKQWDAALPILEQNALDGWTHNKTIQKAVESYRITDEQKTYLRGLKR